MGSVQRRDEARRQAEMESLLLRVQRLEESVKGLDESREAVYRDMEGVQERSRADSEKTATRLSEIESSLKAAEVARAELRDDVVADLSVKMAGIIRSQKPHQQTEVGRRHVVQTGETVSEIAKAYKVTVPAIVKANRLQDASMIRVGQTLFIPE